jgi:hypothetical protein
VNRGSENCGGMSWSREGVPSGVGQ